MEERDDLQAQLQDYAASRRKDFINNKVTRNNTVPTERTHLLSAGPSASNDTNHNCFCSREILSACCANCLCLSSSVQVCRLPFGPNGIPLRIHYLWPFFLVLSAFPAFYTSSVMGVFSLVLGGPVLFMTVLIHELGHATMALKLGGDVSKILIWPLGGLAYISFFGDSNPKADALVAIAGPLTHIPQIAFWISAMYLSNNGQVSLFWPVDWGFNFWLALCSAAILLQISLFLFNLIPAYPLDGGRLFGALLSWLKFNRNTAFMATAFVGSIFGWFFLFEGLRTASSKTFTFYSSGNEMMIGIFILMNCLELWILGSRGAADTHAGFDWAAGEAPATSSNISSQSAPTHHAAPQRGTMNLHGPSDSSSSERPSHSNSGTSAYTTGNPLAVPATAPVVPKPHKMPGIGHKLGTADDKV